MQTRYPVYVISKGRHDCCLTADFLTEDGMDFHIVVEPQEFDLYAEKYGADRLLTLPFSNLGLGSIPARNWCWEHSKELGFERHWIMDDNIRRFRRWFRKKRIPCKSQPAFQAMEDFVDRYENIAIGGPNYVMFAYGSGHGKPPFHLNNHVYSTLLIRNDLPHRWRGRYNEDTDLCLQVLADGWCTILFNAFLIEKMKTMTMKGGNATELYKGDGRLKMARSLERVWPHVVSVDRRFQRPQHVVRDQWEKFDTPLIRRKDIDFGDLKPTEYGMALIPVKDVQSKELLELAKEYNARGKA